MEQKLSTGVRMSKAEALTLVESLKRSIAVGSLVAFGVLAGLVASHAIGNNTDTSNNTIQSQDQNSQDNSGGYFNQQQQGNGYGFGSGGSSQPAVGHSRVS